MTSQAGFPFEDVERIVACLFLLGEAFREPVSKGYDSDSTHGQVWGGGLLNPHSAILHEDASSGLQHNCMGILRSLRKHAHNRLPSQRNGRGISVSPAFAPPTWASQCLSTPSYKATSLA